MKSFSSFHPAVLFFYYVFVLFITMFTLNPVILTFSLIGSLLFFATMTPLKAFCKDIGFYLLVFLLIAITNPLFSHNGETILFFMNDNPVTFEAIIYGVAIATMLVAIIFWSKSYSELVTADKFLYLFGKAVPKLALVVSMALRFIPLFKWQIKKVHQAQKTLGLYTSESVTDKMLSGMRVFNSMLTWSLENAIHQADAMKARGYGLKGRTNFSLFKVEARDRWMFGILVLLLILIVIGFQKGDFAFHYYPFISPFAITSANLIHYISIFLLMFFPCIMEAKENIQWRLLRSKMSASPIRSKRKV
ncbi:ABC transporter permease [Bacillus sp. VT-16-64]|nr:ABC transporter permease [Bacillus sp. VT-16-64]